MAALRNRLIILIFIFSGFLLSGCSYYTYFYVLNATEKKVTAIIKFNHPYRSYWEDNYSSLPDSNSRLNRYIRSMLFEKLKFKALDELTISIDFPPKSRTHIGSTSMDHLLADSIIIIKDDKKEYYSFSDIYKQAEKKRRGITADRNVTYRIN